MRRFSSLAWRSLWSRKLRSLLTIGGIGLGVGVLFAALATNAGIESAIDRTVHEIVGQADLRITAFTERGLGPTTLAAVADTPGVALTAPEIERRTYLQRPIGGQQTGFDSPVTVLGIDPQADPKIHELRIVAGAALARPDEPSVLLTERLVAETGLGLGNEVTMLGASTNGPQRYRVVGIVEGDGPLVGAFGRVAVVPVQMAQTLFATDHMSRIDVKLEPGATLDSVENDLERRITADPYVFSSADDLARSLRSSTSDFQATTTLLAAVALFGGAFLIFNTLSMTVAERVREVGLLRAAGTTRGQVNRLILLQALGLGVAGSLVGILFGVVLAAGMAAYVRSIEAIPIDALQVPIVGIFLAFGVGIFVTLAAALEPAYRAGQISPVEALKARVEAPAGLRARLRWLIAVFAAVAIGGAVFWPRAAGSAESIRALAVYGLLLLGTLVSPFVLGPLGRVAGLPFGFVLKTEERLTRGALVRDRSRAALTVGALTIGLAMIVAIGSVAQSSRQAATAWLAGVVPGDEIVTSIRPAGLDEGIQSELASVDGVERATPIATFEVAYRGVRLDAAAISGADFLADDRLTFVSGDRRAALESLDQGGTVVLPQSRASSLGLRVGDRMSFAVGGGETVELRVVGVVDRGLPGKAGESVFVGWPDATAKLGVTGADFFAVRFQAGRLADAQPALEAKARELALEPNTLDRVQGAISDALGRVFGLFDALAIVAVIVAGLGIVNTLTMNVYERVREIGVLRAAGMTRRQVWRMVVVEAGVLGVVGGVLGCLVGVGVGLVMVSIGSGFGAPLLDLPWTTIGLAGLFGVVVAMLAAYYPARLASRVSIVRAVQFE